MKSPSLRHRDERSITQQAQEWMLVLPTADAETRSRFAAWIRRSPQHVQTYMELHVLEAELAGVRELPDDPDFDIEALLAEAGNVVPLPGRLVSGSNPRAGRLTHWTNVLGQIAVAATSILVGWAIWSIQFRPIIYETKTGEQRHIRLRDGSTLDLNTQTRVEVRLDKLSRNVALIAGEAFFDVHADPSRPFRVSVGTAVIDVLGTRFDVDRHSDTAAVSVVEGRVAISSAARPPIAVTGETDGNQRTAGVQHPVKSVELSAGQQANILSDGQVRHAPSPDITQAASWRQQKLWFDGQTLAEISDEFNRYNITPKLHIEGAALREQRISGVFKANDPRSFIAFLKQTFDIDAEEHGEQLDIRLRR